VTLPPPRAVLCADDSFADFWRHVVTILARVPADTAEAVAMSTVVEGPGYGGDDWTNYRCKHPTQKTLFF